MSEQKRHFCWKRLCWKSCLISLEGAALVLVFLAAMVAIFMWRLSTSPLDLEFARPMVERALSEQSDTHVVTIDKLILHWPERKGPLLLGIRGGAVQTTAGEPVIDIAHVGMGLSLPHLLIGRVVPTLLVLEQPHISLVVSPDGRLDFGLGDTPSQAAYITDEQISLLERVVGAVGSPYKEAYEASPLSALEQFEIRRAMVDVEDQITKASWQVPRFDLQLRTEDQGLAGDAHVYLSVDRDLSHLSAKVDMPWQAQEAIASLTVNALPMRYFAEKIPDLARLQADQLRVSGTVEARLDSNLRPMDVQVDLRSDGADMVISDYRAEATSVRDLHVAGRYDAQAQLAVLDDLSLSVAGVGMVASGQIQAHEQAGYQADLKLSVPQVRQDQFVDILPDVTKDEGVYEWLVDKLSGGVFDDVKARAQLVLNPPVAGEAEADSSWGVEIADLRADFKYRDMVIDYKQSLTPISDAVGSGWFDYVSELLHVELDSGTVGNLQARAGQVELAHIVEGGRGVADVNVTLIGPLPAVFEYLEAEPIAFKHGYNLARMEGAADINVNIGLPTHGDVSMDDMLLQVRGAVSDAVLPSVLQGRDVRAAQAKVVIDQNDVSVAGSGLFAHAPVQFDYSGFLSSNGKPYQEKIVVTGWADKALRDIFELDLTAFMDGTVGVAATYTKINALSQTLDVKADLKPARVFVDALGYEKPIGQAGSAQLRVNFRDGVAQDVTQLSAQAKDLMIQGGTLDFETRGGQTDLAGGSTARFAIGQTTGALDFDMLENGHYRLSPVLEVLDLRPVLAAEKNDEDTGAGQDPLVLVVQAQRILTHKDQSVRQGKIYADMDAEGRFNQLELDAVTANGSDIYLRYKPDDIGNRTFRFEADDAGETLVAFGLYDKIRGGKILIHADPMRGADDKNLVGVAEITNFEVVGAPTLAKLLSLMSLEGLAKGLTSTGIQFSRLESKFDWLYKPQGSLLVLEGGRTSGAAVGLTFDGVIDQAAGTIDVSGTLVPVSDVNQVIKSIPLLGEILTGGSGVFAATYSVKGQTDNPRVSVNPLSVLAPGILRRILFE